MVTKGAGVVYLMMFLKQKELYSTWYSPESTHYTPLPALANNNKSSIKKIGPVWFVYLS